MLYFNIDTTVYSLLYSVYSLPNIIAPFLSGILILTIGKETALIIFSTFIVLGQFITAIGPITDLYILMIIGRCIYGLGCEIMNVVTALYVIDWFYD